MIPTRHLPRLALHTLAFLAAASVPFAAQAATFCAANSEQLQQALVTAGANGEADEVRIRTTVGLPAGAADTTATYRLTVTDGRSVDISGGWTNAGCSDFTPRVEQTLLVSNGNRSVLHMEVSGNVTPRPTLSLRRLQFSSLGFARPGVAACAVDVSGYVNVDLSSLIVRNLNCMDGSALVLSVAEGDIRIANSLFADNNLAGPVLLGFNHDGATAGSALLVNNTFAYNTVQTWTTLERLRLHPQAIGRMENNVVWGNLTQPPQSGAVARMFALVVNAANGSIRNNRVQSETYSGPFLQSDSHNSSGDPGLVDQGIHLVPAVGSPLRNAGTASPSWMASSFDVQGQPRLQEGRLDIGAYEYQPPLFADGFEAQID